MLNDPHSVASQIEDARKQNVRFPQFVQPTGDLATTYDSEDMITPTSIVTLASKVAPSPQALEALGLVEYGGNSSKVNRVESHAYSLFHW
jgi:hypothetical protein